MLHIIDDNGEITSHVKSLAEYQAAKIAEIKDIAWQICRDLEGHDGWKLRRAEQRAAAGNPVERDALYAALEMARTRSDELEGQVMAMTDPGDVWIFNPVSEW